MHRTVKVACVTGALMVWAAAGLAAGPRRPTTAKDQVEFGVKMASEGLWSEALFRFKQAERMEPGKASVYNNLAVASEALGQFEDALAFYRRALEIAPSDRGIRNNYARFVEFYQSFKPPETEDEKATGEDGEDQAGDGDSA